MMNARWGRIQQRRVQRPLLASKVQKEGSTGKAQASSATGVKIVLGALFFLTKSKVGRPR